MSLSAVLNNLANTGITSQTPFNLRNKLRVFNNANLVIFFIDIFYVIIGLVNNYHVAVGFTTFSLISTLATYYFIRKNKYELAFHYTIFYGFIFLSSFSFLFGSASNSYYYFLFIPVACNILFDNLRIILVYVAASIVLMALNVYYIENHLPYYEVNPIVKLFNYPNILFASVLIFLGVRLFKEENIKYSFKIEEQKKVLEEKNQEITDSINYARKIQLALIPGDEEFINHFKESFVLLKPKDIVSGDFYWVTKKNEFVFYATGDCTGHGVPGGFMTMLGISFLDEIVNEKNVNEPAEILNALRERIIHTLKQTGTAGESKDGMDIVLCRLNTLTNEVCYSAANNSLYVLQDGQLNEFKPDKQPCGFYHGIKPFTQHIIKLQNGNCIYTLTDGFADQFGGPKGKKFKYKQLEKLILEQASTPLKQQKEKFERAFEDWRGALEQIDDVCLIAVRV